LKQAFVEPDPQQPYGHALVRLPGAASAAADPRFLIRREGYEKGVLGPGGWQVGEAHLSPLSADADGEDLVIRLGPQVVDLLEPGTVLLTVPAARFDGIAVWPDIAPSYTGSTSRLREPPLKPEPKNDTRLEPERMVEPRPQPEPKPGPEPEPKPEPSPLPPHRRWPLYGAVLALLLIVAGGYGVWRLIGPFPLDCTSMPGGRVPEGCPGPVVPRPGPGPSARAECETGTPAQIIGCHLTPQRLAELGQKLMDSGRANDAELLWETGADQGSGAAALRLAKLYDPNSFRPGGPVPRPDPRLAAKYYKQAVDAGEADGADPREALHRYLEDRRQRGDQDARILLQEFWP
jgi:hypothetical protein